MSKIDDWKEDVDYPDYMLYPSLSTLSQGYLLENETPRDAMQRCAKTAANLLKRPDWEQYFFEALWKGWLCMATPVFMNFGTDRGMPISCYIQDVKDDLYDIGMKNLEMMMLTKNSGGVGININRLRGRGEKIGKYGASSGIVPFASIYDTTIRGVVQGSRRGAASLNLNIRHKDIYEFIRLITKDGGHLKNIKLCVQVTDEFMESVANGNDEDCKLWAELLRIRKEEGHPYIQFIDTTNKLNPECYKKNELEVNATNICSEITGHTDPEHTVVCCLSSLNLLYWNDWKDYKFGNGMSLPTLGTYFLDAVMEEFIQKSNNKPGLENARRFAMKSRMLGLGVLGYHSYLQSKMLPFIGLYSTSLTHQMFKFISEEAKKASQEMAIEYGEPEWCKGFGVRNTHNLALAPTFTNAIIAGVQSSGIEPIKANAFNLKTVKGLFAYQNPHLKEILKKHNKNDRETWLSINGKDGSVQHLDFLSQEEKEVFLTFQEINQLDLIRLAGDRQKYIDQGVSLNLMFSSDVDPEWVQKCHFEAWSQNIKTLYYMYSFAPSKADSAQRVHERTMIDNGCASCEG